MKFLVRTIGDFEREGRWDIDYHLPAELIRAFPQETVMRLDEVAQIVAKESRDPASRPSELFTYVDISSVSVTRGEVLSTQELLGEEAPSRARKIIHAFDILVSTVRPTRGAVAVVPEVLDNQIASTGFSVVRARPEINPFYLHFALRLPSTKEQFRKWSTGSSYPAILDSDVAKTLIPVPSSKVQDEIAVALFEGERKRQEAIRILDSDWSKLITRSQQMLGLPEDTDNAVGSESDFEPGWSLVPTIENIAQAREVLRAKRRS